MTDDQVQHSGGRQRILLGDLRYPVLVIERGEFHICPTPASLPGRPGLYVDNQGLAYQVVDVDDPLVRDGKPLPRAERVRVFKRGLENAGYIHYEGKPVQLSVDVVRQKIAWVVSARGHFEIPQGLPDLSRATSVAELVGILLTTGFR